MSDLADIREQVRGRLDWPRVASALGLEVKKSGANTWTCCCPFHAEKSPSFVMGGGGKYWDKSHCFGCAEGDHDFFGLWQVLRGVDHKRAVLDLAEIAGVPVGTLEFYHEKSAGKPRVIAERPVMEDDVSKPSLPPLQRLNEAGCELLARSRGLPVWAVKHAVKMGRVVYSRWPLYEREGKWMPACAVHGKSCSMRREECEPAETFPSWGATDRTLNTVEWRRLDNGMYRRHDGEEIKAWGMKGKAWPLGAMEVAQCKWVMLVEGGPDMLAAYALLGKHGMLAKVVPVCMLGASNRMREDAMHCFEGARVRIMVDADALKDDVKSGKRKLPGLQAAAKWQAQMQEAGAAVECFYVGDVYETGSLAAWQRGEIESKDVVVDLPGFADAEGKRCKDVNDIIKAGESVFMHEAIREAAKDWDF